MTIPNYQYSTDPPPSVNASTVQVLFILKFDLPGRNLRRCCGSVASPTEVPVRPDLDEFEALVANCQYVTQFHAFAAVFDNSDCLPEDPFFFVASADGGTEFTVQESHIFIEDIQLCDH